MNRYGPKARKEIEDTMHEYARGGLKGGHKEPVRNRKQAVAIGISKARRKHYKVPAEES